MKSSIFILKIPESEMKELVSNYPDGIDEEQAILYHLEKGLGLSYSVSYMRIISLSQPSNDD